MPSKNVQPALIGGLFIGVLSALPIVNFANCCCLWVIGGGIITAYLMQNASATAITIGDGALGGLIAGIVGAIIDTILSIPIRLLMGPMQMQLWQRWMESATDVPDSLRVFMEPGVTGFGILISIIVSFMLMLVIGAIFATIGGMVGAAIFNRNKPTVVPAPPPPPQP
jgi:large-conductance mechanosensitive channel